MCLFRYLASTLEPVGNGNIRFSLVISNRTRLPAIGMTGLVKLELPDEKVHTIFKNSGHFSNRAGICIG
jgi:hypothetical protein